MAVRGGGSNRGSAGGDMSGTGALILVGVPAAVVGWLFLETGVAGILGVVIAVVAVASFSRGLHR